MNKPEEDETVKTGQNKQENSGEKEKLAGKSPDEKLHGVPPPGSAVPGAQNPDSEEIKKEVNPNTE